MRFIMNQKEFSQLRETLKKNIENKISDFLEENHLDEKLKLNHVSRLQMYVEGINTTLKTIAEESGLRYRSFKSPASYLG